MFVCRAAELGSSLLQGVGVQRVYSGFRGDGAVLEKRNHTSQSLCWTLGTLSLLFASQHHCEQDGPVQNLFATAAPPSASPYSFLSLGQSRAWGRSQPPGQELRSMGRTETKSPPGQQRGGEEQPLSPLPHRLRSSPGFWDHISILGCRPPLMGTKEGGGTAAATRGLRGSLRHLPLPGTRPLPGPRRPPPFRGAGPGGAESDRIGSSWIGSGWLGSDRVGSEQVRSSGGTGAARGR